MPVYLSPSRLNRFAECPRCFWLQVNAGEDRPSGPFPSLPGGMDRAIKAHFDRHRERGDLPPELRGVVDARLEPDPDFLDGCRDWRREPHYVDGDLDVVVRGGIDDLLRDDRGRLAVLDYKTRGYPPKGDSGAPDYYARQVATYTLILRSAGHETADHGYLLYYYPDGADDDGRFRFHTELRRVPVDVGAVREQIRRAVVTLRGPLPDHDPDCEFCAWNAAEHG